MNLWNAVKIVFLNATDILFEWSLINGPFLKIARNSEEYIKAYSVSCQKYEMERFPKLVNGF